MSEEESLQIVDTSDVLTKDELAELKKLAALSKTTRTIFAFAMGIVALFGIDKLFEFITTHHA